MHEKGTQMSKKKIINYEWVLGYADGLNALYRDLAAQNSYLTEEQAEAVKDIMRAIRAHSDAANYMVGAARATMRSEERTR